MKHIFLHCCLHFSIGFSFFIFTWVFFMPLPSGFWLLASAASGFWLLRLLDSLAFGCWLVAFASRRILHVVCWSFGFLPLACARGMKTLLIRVLTSPFRGKKRMSGHLLNLGSNYVHVIWVEQWLQDPQTFTRGFLCMFVGEELKLFSTSVRASPPFNKCPD